MSRRSRGQETAVRPSLSALERESVIVDLLDRTEQILTECSTDAQQVGLAMHDLFGGLFLEKKTATDEEWQACVKRCRDHKLLELIHEDPFTGRAFNKPRGYAGDAELIDLIYGPEERWPLPSATVLGENIYRYTSSAPAAEGVRARRAFIADLIDRLVTNTSGKDILAVAAGHLREACMTTAVRRRRLNRFVALDSDPVSLDLVKKNYGTYGVSTCHAPFSHLITGRVQLEPFDLVYTTGLYDYLSRNTGRRLVRTMFDMLKPGGQLVVANFMPGIRDIGYMEAFMDWKLIYRNRHDMDDLSADIDESELRSTTLLAEEHRNIIFMILHKN